MSDAGAQSVAFVCNQYFREGAWNYAPDHFLGSLLKQPQLAQNRTIFEDE